MTYMIVFNSPTESGIMQVAPSKEKVIEKVVAISTGKEGSGKLKIERIFSVNPQGNTRQMGIQFIGGVLDLIELGADALIKPPDLRHINTDILVHELMNRKSIEYNVLDAGQSVIVMDASDPAKSSSYRDAYTVSIDTKTKMKKLTGPAVILVATEER